MYTNFLAISCIFFPVSGSFFSSEIPEQNTDLEKLSFDSSCPQQSIHIRKTRANLESSLGNTWRFCEEVTKITVAKSETRTRKVKSSQNRMLRRSNPNQREPQNHPIIFKSTNQLHSCTAPSQWLGCQYKELILVNLWEKKHTAKILFTRPWWAFNYTQKLLKNAKCACFWVIKDWIKLIQIK